MSDQKTTAVAKVEELGIQVPKLLENADARIAQAEQALDARIPEVFIDEEHVELGKRFIGSVKQIHDTLHDTRAPLTRILDDIRAEFTTREKKLMSIVDKVKARHNAYTAKQLAEARKIEEEARKKADAERNAIEQKQKAESILNSRIDAYVDKVREHAGKVADSVTKSNIKELEKKLSGSPKWGDSYDKHYSDKPEGIDKQLWDSMINDFKELHKARYIEEGKEVMESAKNLLPIVLKNADDAKRLREAEAKKVEEERKEREELAKAKADGEAALSQLDHHADVPEVKANVDWEIEVKSAAAYLQLVMFWWENEDQGNKTLEKVEKWTFPRAKKFTERYAKKHGKIVDHKDIIYHEVIKGK